MPPVGPFTKPTFFGGYETDHINDFDGDRLILRPENQESDI